MSTKLENFENAFDSHVGSCRMTCNCGKEFWDAYNSGYGWDEGEREALEKDPNAVAVQHSVGSLEFEGRIYCLDCDCWHERAKKIMGFIDSHGKAIAEYLFYEKKRKQAIADAAPTVEELENVEARLKG